MEKGVSGGRTATVSSVVCELAEGKRPSELGVGPYLVVRLLDVTDRCLLVYSDHIVRVLGSQRRPGRVERTLGGATGRWPRKSESAPSSFVR